MSDDNTDKNSDEDNSRPDTPSNDDCCGNSCNPCIFDVHKKMLDQWEKRKIEGITCNRGKNILSPVLYKKFQVSELMEVAEEFIKIRLVYSRQIDSDSSLFLKPGQHVILFAHKKSRPYTPISWSKKSLDFLIKSYPDGAFSQDLKRLKIGDEIRVRGPYGDFKYERNSFKQIVAFSIGSGIAAIFPIAKAIVDDETEETRIHIVAGFRTFAQVPLRKELRQLSDYWNVACRLQISKPEGVEIYLSGMKIGRGRLTESVVNELLEIHSPENTLILICGTQQFNESMVDWIKNSGYFHYHVFS